MEPDQEYSPLQLQEWDLKSSIPKGISVYCDKITDPQNFGAILRSALFYGVSAVFTGRKHHCPLNSTVSKTSAGAIYNIPICKEKTLYNTVKFLHSSGIQTIACTEKGNQNYFEQSFHPT